MTLHTSWPLSCWLWISPGSSSTCRSIQARDRGFVRCLKMGYTSENILKIYISKQDLLKKMQWFIDLFRPRKVPMFRQSHIVYFQANLISVSPFLCFGLESKQTMPTSRNDGVLLIANKDAWRCSFADYFSGDVFLDSNHIRLKAASWKANMGGSNNRKTNYRLLTFLILFGHGGFSSVFFPRW